MPDSIAEIIDRYSPFPSLVVGLRDLTQEQVIILQSNLEIKLSLVRNAEEEAAGLYERPDIQGLLSRSSWNQPIYVTMDVWSNALLAEIVYIDVTEQLKHDFKSWGKATYAHVTFHIGLPYEEKSEIIREQELSSEQLGDCASSGRVLVVDINRPSLEYFVKQSQTILESLFSKQNVLILGIDHFLK